jgi:formamidopyrimidine-DNA glycosylase
VPELPEVESLVRFLSEQAAGQVVSRVELVAFAALKTFDPPLEALVGRIVGRGDRRGKFLCLPTYSGAAESAGAGEPMWLVMHLARGGWVQWRDSLPAGRAKPGKGPLALRVGLEGGTGFEVTEMGTEKRLAVYVVRDPALVEGVARLGPDPLAPGFDADLLGQRLRATTGHVKGALADQAIIAGVGNAYSDEALLVARLSPFKKAASLSDDEVARLHDALTEVLTDALARSAGLPAKGLKAEKKSGLRVHGRTGEACPICGDTVREVSFATKSFQYCPTCQTGGRVLADRRLSRLLK